MALIAYAKDDKKAEAASKMASLDAKGKAELEAIG